MPDSTQPKSQTRAIDIQVEGCGLRVAVAWLFRPGLWPELVVAYAHQQWQRAGFCLHEPYSSYHIVVRQAVASFEAAGNFVENVGCNC